MKPELEKLIQAIEKVIVGKRNVVEKILTALLAGGHILLDDAPGTGKTTLALAVSRALGLTFRRVQFTPDVLPSDLVGFSVYDQRSGGMTFQAGVLQGTHLLLGDEINRASGRTQSALLEAMEEKQVTVDGNTYPLADPFLVIATRNQIGAEGTRPLPFAQMDRFMVCLSIGDPDEETLLRLLRDRQKGNPLQDLRPVMSREELLNLQRQTRETVSRDSILEYIARLVLASRVHPLLETGISPRGALFLDRMAKARACLEGRDYVTGADVQAVFPDVCAHRIRLKSGTEGVTESQLLEELLAETEVPERRGRL